MLAVVQDVRIIVLAVPHGVVVALGATAVQEIAEMPALPVLDVVEDVLGVQAVRLDVVQLVTVDALHLALRDVVIQLELEEYHDRKEQSKGSFYNYIQHHRRL